MNTRLMFLVILLVFCSTNLQANSAISINRVSLHRFIEEARDYNLPTGFIEECLTHLDYITFGNTDISGATASYTVSGSIFTGEYRRIIFSESLYDAKHRTILSLSDAAFAPDDLGTVFHEFWHCYEDVIRENGGWLYNKLMDGINYHYAKYNYHVREEIQSEAIGVAISSFVSTVFHHRRTYRMRPNLRASLASSETLSAGYERTFTNPIYGYFRHENSVLFVNVPLRLSDKTLILENLLEYKFRPSYIDFIAMEERFLNPKEQVTEELASVSD